MGPIPWNVIVQYAEYNGLEPDITDLLIRVVRALDIEYLDWCKENTPKPEKPQRIDNARFSNQSQDRSTRG